MNMTVLEYGEDMIIIDAGLMFPEEDMLAWTLSSRLHLCPRNREKVRAIFLTHGHEDHVGALPFLLREIRSRLCTPLTLGLVREKLKEHNLEDIELRSIRPR